MKLLLPLLALGLVSNNVPVKKAALNSISDSYFCFYENDKVADTYAEEDIYKFDQVLNVSGVDWVFSNFAYGLDEKTHQPIDHKALYCDTIWNQYHNLSLSALSSADSPFYNSAYKNDYEELLLNGQATFSYNAVVMSKDYFEPKFIEDITLFTHYSTGELGVDMMIKPEGESWKRLYTYGGASHFMSHYAGTIDDLIDDGVSNNYVPAQTVYIDGGAPYTRYFDSYCTYHDDKFSNIPDKPFKFAFVLQASMSYQFDFVLDGIMVNKKNAMKNYLNGILDKTICGTEFNSNFAQSFALMDKVMSETDIEYLSTEYHEDDKGSCSYYDTYTYLNDVLNGSGAINKNANGFINLIANATYKYSTVLLVSGLSFASIIAYYIFIKKRKAKNN